ncbi:Molecular chaperone IbpA, HSP20 family [Rhizobium sp. NFR07]|uniref:Hsp20 family protein n=1 Tax=Rhizobium sp. NFR07 TaxID=1566262 RepID=UPI0008E1B466|nr:Hsp20 family protein [Rhizobium sp. NFR07]SFA97215.1 Molecular chaperone IbpA, HSP20 family [Rhizobium sp. NFR07]
MSRMTPFASPLLLGFDAMEKTLERLAKANEGYPPYNIERVRPDAPGGDEKLRITLAVAGFSEAELDVTTEENQLIIRGRQIEQPERAYLYRGIAARQFQRVFVLADGMEVSSASLRNGLLSVDLTRPEPQRVVRKINISVSE